MRRYILLAGDPSRFEMALDATRDAALANGAALAVAEEAVMRERHAHYQCGRRTAVVTNHHAGGRYYVRATRDGVEDGAPMADGDLDGTFTDAVGWAVMWAAEDPACRAVYISAAALALHRHHVAAMLAQGAA